MKPVDWIQTAAREIANAINPTPFVVVQAYGIIARHSPMKPNVAYMPVPRCVACIRWTRHTEDPEIGVCSLRDAPDSKMWPEAHDAIYTEPDFGCVQWEAIL